MSRNERDYHDWLLREMTRWREHLPIADFWDGCSTAKLRRHLRAPHVAVRCAAYTELVRRRRAR